MSRVLFHEPRKISCKFSLRRSYNYHITKHKVIPETSVSRVRWRVYVIQHESVILSRNVTNEITNTLYEILITGRLHARLQLPSDYACTDYYRFLNRRLLYCTVFHTRKFRFSPRCRNTSRTKQRRTARSRHCMKSHSGLSRREKKKGGTRNIPGHSE